MNQVSLCVLYELLVLHFVWWLCGTLND